MLARRGLLGLVTNLGGVMSENLQSCDQPEKVSQWLIA